MQCKYVWSYTLWETELIWTAINILTSAFVIFLGPALPRVFIKQFLQFTLAIFYYLVFLNCLVYFFTAQKKSMFIVILVRIFPHSGWIRKECKCGKIRTRITPNTFYVVFRFIYTFNAFLSKTYITWIFLNPFRLQFSLKLIVFNQLQKDLWDHIPPSKVSKPVPETS